MLVCPYSLTIQLTRQASQDLQVKLSQSIPIPRRPIDPHILPNDGIFMTDSRIKPITQLIGAQSLPLVMEAVGGLLHGFRVVRVVACHS